MISPHRLFKIIGTASLFLLTACQEWTPLAEGYFSVDDHRYKVHILYLFSDESKIAFQGNEVNVVVYLRAKPALTVGTYNVSNDFYPTPDAIQVSVNGTPYDVSSYMNSSGIMNVARSGGDYVVDFTGTIEGHQVEVHYKGLASRQ